MIQKLKQFKDKTVERFEEVQEKFRAQWLAFSPREKMIVSSLVGVLTLLIIALVVKETSGLLTKVSSQAEMNFNNIEKIQNLLRDLTLQRGDLMKYERLRGKRGSEFDLQKYIQQEAARYGATVAKISPTRALAADGNEIKDEDWAEVQLKDATLDSALKLLSSVEETLGLKVISLNIKPQFADPTKLDITTVISNTKEL